MITLTTIRGNGNIKTKTASKDGVSGILMYIPAANYPTSTTDVSFSATNPIIKIGSIDEAEALGIKKDCNLSDNAVNWDMRSLYYHLNECFRINPGIELYVGLFVAPTTSFDFVEIKKMVSYADGEIRQIGVYAPNKEYEVEDVKSLQAIATLEESYDTPISIIYFPKVTNTASITIDGKGAGNKNVSVCIGQEADENTYAYKLYTDASNTTAKRAVGIVGIFMGLMSKASVQECIAWVEKFPTGISVAGTVDGKKMRDITRSVIDTWEEKRLLYLKTYTGYPGVFLSESHNMDLPTSDYNAIERTRTMDKACRGVRLYLLPYLGSNIDIDPETGKIGQTTIAILTNEANSYLEDMEKAGEESGFKVYIDSDQNVLGTSQLEIVIKQVPKGVMRKLVLKMNFTDKIS